MDVGFFKKSIPTLRFLIVFSIVGITVFYQLMSQEERLKIYNPIDINPRLVDISVKNLKKIIQLQIFRSPIKMDKKSLIKPMRVRFILQIFSLLAVRPFVFLWLII